LGTQRKQVAAEITEALDALPLSRLLISMPGVGVRTAARILMEVGHGSNFPTAGPPRRLPCNRASDTAFGHQHRRRIPIPKREQERQKRVLMSGFACLRPDPTSRAYYDRKRGEGKKHNTSIICLARRRCDVIYAMLRDRREYQAPLRIPASPAATDSDSNA